jgi:hypothetical protein
MPIEPPEPLAIADALSIQLAQLRTLITYHPEQSEYSTAADLVGRAIEEIKIGAAAQQQAR